MAVNRRRKNSSSLYDETRKMKMTAHANFINSTKASHESNVCAWTPRAGAKAIGDAALAIHTLPG
jgi:hypothetical protein